MSQAGYFGSGGSGPTPPFGPLKLTFVTGPTTYTVVPTDEYITVNDAAGPSTILLPNTTTTGRIIIIKDRTGTDKTNVITVTTVGGTVMIDGMTTVIMDGVYDSLTLVFDGTNYEVW